MSGVVRFADEKPTVEVVQLEGVALLKMLQHAKSAFPSFVSGSLVGLNVGKDLEITNCFGFVTVTEADEDEQDFQLEMLRHLRQVHVDNNSIGWYQSTYLGTYCSKELIQTQYSHQQKNPDSVVIVFDPVSTAKGTLALKALRLTESFMKSYNPTHDGIDILSTVPSGSIFQELPVRIRNSDLIKCFLLDVASASESATETTEDGSSDFDCLDLTANAFLEHNLEEMIKQMEDLSSTQPSLHAVERKLAQHRRQRQQWLLRRREENERIRHEGGELLPSEPSEDDPISALPDQVRQDKDKLEREKLDSLLISAQISAYCDQVNKFAGQSFGKLFLAGGLNE